MIEFHGHGLLLDIEGTTSSVRFVYDVMFPLVLDRLDGFLERRGGDADVVAACERIAADAGSTETSTSWVAAEVRRLMDGDVKATGLKQLQGLIWKDSFESGELEAHVYDDVPAALEHWQQLGRDLRVYSSGSIQAQRLFFGHTIHGDLLPHFTGHYDTTIGGKKEPDSYRAILADWGLPGEQVLFASDVTAELDAAREAGMQTVLLRRPGNAEPPAGHGHPEASSLDEIQLG
ncbi:MAG: acireductone synthase [Planctomycetales bacterium]|nr:acireductone synthase [Planctomycetales bacterium]